MRTVRRSVFIVKTRKKIQTNLGEKDIRDDEISEDTREEDSTHVENISFHDDEDSTASQEEDVEDWIEYLQKKHERS